MAFKKIRKKLYFPFLFMVFFVSSCNNLKTKYPGLAMEIARTTETYHGNDDVTLIEIKEHLIGIREHFPDRYYLCTLGERRNEYLIIEVFYNIDSMIGNTDFNTGILKAYTKMKQIGFIIDFIDADGDLKILESDTYYDYCICKPKSISSIDKISDYTIVHCFHPNGCLDSFVVNKMGCNTESK